MGSYQCKNVYLVSIDYKNGLTIYTETLNYFLGTPKSYAIKFVWTI